MISGRDFIVFSDDWGRHPFSCQHIMSFFLQNNRILWVNTIGMRNPRLSGYDIRRSVEKVAEWLRGGEGTETVDLPENLNVISPVMTPFQNIPLVRWMNQRSVVAAVRRAMGTLQLHNPILVATLPNATDYVGHFGEAAVVYYSVDDFTQWPGVDPCFITELEEGLLRQADFVCASADNLCEKKTRLERRPMLLSHGVDFDHFSAGDHCRAGKIKGIPSPVVGFFGAISPWLDFDLIATVAASHPQWSFVFVGPSDVDVSRLQALPNIHLLGKVPYAELPDYSAAFDVALIPFLVNDLTVSVNPLKLMEYLACGLPVVSTKLPEVMKHRDAVYIADNADGFGRMIELALQEDSEQKRRRRQDLARAHSWRAVAERLSGAIIEVFAVKSGNKR